VKSAELAVAWRRASGERLAFCIIALELQGHDT
jgi:hypothetical protein